MRLNTLRQMLFRFRDPEEIAELTRFVLVAVVGLGIDMFVAWNLAVQGNVPLLWAAVIGFVVAAAFNCLVHDYWTFRGGARRVTPLRAFRYFAVLGLALSVRILGVTILAWLMGDFGTKPLGQFIILLGATGGSFIVNYLASRIFVFVGGQAKMSVLQDQ